MEEIFSSRDKDINELINFATKTKNKLNEMVLNMGWSERSITDISPPLVCPFDSSHRLHPKSVEKHIENCLWKAEGYSRDDLPLSLPSVPPDASTCIKLDEKTIAEILRHSKPPDAPPREGVDCRLIPRTSDRLLTDFTPEERRILYDYVVSHTEQPDIGEDIADLNKTNRDEANKTSSYLELLAQERNLKRRRVKHRGVHTNKKSQTEIMREVINQQMEMLAEYLVEKNQSNKVTSDAEGERDVRNGVEPLREDKRDSRNRNNSRDERNSSRDFRRESRDFASCGDIKSHSKHSKSSRSRRHSEERKKHKKHERHRSRDREKHKLKSRKRSRSREDKNSRKRRRSP
ncbi:U11/U12 small nuclear ribonucleoprotein 48 kDa protein [Diachasma alloeum]|uniref:U11/U12 small nuclear ribonucleoprotein 48 kDa protein n=1 Tax=Diachasma alloeum TaxID=454923 RepID=UPI0007384A76|nr:U11/U12 small nuclear ribonucleoprotein 48 kDa protein [Diachasma alloeum]